MNKTDEAFINGQMAGFESATDKTNLKTSLSDPKFIDFFAPTVANLDQYLEEKRKLEEAIKQNNERLATLNDLIEKSTNSIIYQLKKGGRE